MNDFEVVWAAGGSFPLRVERRPDPSLPDGQRFRIQLAAGAVVLAYRGADVLLVQQFRPAVDATLWELPRGLVSESDEHVIATGCRELAEETGYVLGETRLLGRFVPDSGLLASEIGVVRGTVADAAPASVTDGEIEHVRWASPEELRQMVRDGSVRDGISLAALTVAGSVMP